MRDLKEIRLSFGLTKSKMAKIMGIHPKTYANYEAGKHPIRLLPMIRLAQYLDTSLDYLFDLTDDPRPYR